MNAAPYGTLGAMTALGAIEWPLAVVVATSHLVGENPRSETVSGAAEPAGSAAS